ncbi:MAG: alanine--tRNA ligase [Euryarchaeota archaeon]|nr:alanine--tRNA ligase [Euryarchaeota archaeon]
MTDAAEYDLRFFHDNSFARRKCPKCGRHFWTQGAQATCGETPCEPYGFLGKPPMKKGMSLHEMREAYLSYFERNGHRRVARYPITARWRDDVFFTQASIYDFQPWVLNGTIKPPANPLCISQTCARFNDIDNVGRTGSHFTMFEMMAHHAFNTKDEQIYFKDRTVELCDGLLKELGITPEHITYIEADWEGGGNSGPCFEVVVDGVELATLVFMQYAETDKGKVPLPMKVVDTGYGLERFTWMSQGASSAYEAVFGPALARMKRETGFSGDKTILAEYSKMSGMLNLDTAADLRAVRQNVADALGIPLGRLMQETGPMESIYVACDHARALMFLLNDGVMPSNVKAGYFARLLIRRALRSMASLGLKLPLSAIVEEHIGFYKPQFPEVGENREGILKLVDVEEERYRETLSKGRALVSQMESKLGGKGFSVDALIELYDSHGLNPEIVKDFAKVPVDVPDDFYKQVSARHIKPAKDAEAKEDVAIDVPPTEMLFYKEPYMREFSANVLQVFGNEVALDRTAFYPEGGGQESDAGTLDGLKVLRARKVGAVVLHEIEGDVSKLKAGKTVKGGIDWPRRRQLMRHHTGAHIINAAARMVLGKHVWQAGANKSAELARLDITHYQSLSKKEIAEIEEVANRIVLDDIQIDSAFMERSAAEREHGFRLYQGGAVPGRDIRVVHILGEDVEACGGTHCARTGEVGLLKITGVKRIQDGIVRIEFKAGRAAYDHVRDEQNHLAKAAETLGVQAKDLPMAIERLMDEHRGMRKQVENSEKESWKKIAIEEAEKSNGEPLFEISPFPYERKKVQEISKSMVSTSIPFFGIYSNDEKPTIFIGSSSDKIPADVLSKPIKEEMGLKGGGDHNFVTITAPSQDIAADFIKRLQKKVEETK